MRLVALVTLTAGIAFGIGFFAGGRGGDQAGHSDADSGEGLAVSVARMARALERVEARLTPDAPMLATRPSDPSSGPGNADCAKLLAGIAERLDRLGSAQGEGLAPATPRERTAEQTVRLASLADAEAQAMQKDHFMATGRDLLRSYGVPNVAQHWTGATVRWVYLLDQDATSGARVVFELIGGYVTAAALQRGP